MKKSLSFVLVLFFAVLLHAQINLKDSVVKVNIIQVDLGIGLPLGNMAETFGVHQTVGGGYQFKNNKNFLIGFNGSYIFGSHVKDSSVNFLFTQGGSVIGTDGYLFSPILFEQGFDLKFQMGKITNILALNPNSGLAVLGGVGYLQHNILIYIDEAYVPQLNKEYRKGYDRLTNGIALNQYIGYYFFSNKNFVNFRAGFDITEAFTKNRRYNFDTQSIDEESKFDMLVTFKATWNLCIFEKPQRKFYY
ncbi:MAG: hypothetical protein H7Y00_03065 [Fimbriimonadaceae bacterium]|nr:hypothetical protein [Chitinophagales bacterium]